MSENRHTVDTTGKMTSEEMITEIARCINSLPTPLYESKFVRCDEESEYGSVESDTFRIDCYSGFFTGHSLLGPHTVAKVCFRSSYINEDGDSFEIEGDLPSLQSALFACWARQMYWQFCDNIRSQAMIDDIKYQKENAEEIKKVVEEGKRQVGY